jgi:hypothetical protein
MRPPTREPARPPRTLPLALHAVGASALGAWAALLFTVACAPDLIGGPSGPPLEAAVEAPVVVEPAAPPTECDAVRPARIAIRDMTGVDPMCVAPDAQPAIWLDHYARRVSGRCECPLAGR